MAATSVFAGVLIAKSGGFGLPIMGVQDQWRKVVLGSTSLSLLEQGKISGVVVQTPTAWARRRSS